MENAATTQQLHDEIHSLRTQLSTVEQEMSRQKALGETWREEAERYRKLIEASNDAIFLIDLDRDRILDANPTACQMLGYSRTELLALGVSAIHPNEMPQLAHFAQQVFAKGRGWTDELSCRTKTGAALPAEISASLVEIDGQTCLLALVRDTSERKQAEARIKREVARADALARVAARLNAQLDLETVSNAICEETMHALQVSAAVLLFFDQKQQVFYPVATGGLPVDFKTKYTPNPRAVYDQYPQEGSQIVVPNLRDLPNLVNADLFEEYGIHAIALAGLNREEHLLGALSAYSLDPNHVFDEDDISLLRTLADLGAQAVRKAMLYQTEQRRSAQFKTISEVGRHITSILDVDELICQIAHSVKQVFGPSHVGVLLVEEDDLVIVEPPPRFHIGLDRGITGWVARHGRPALVDDVTQDGRFFAGSKWGIRSELTVPIKVQNRVIGVLDVESIERDAYDEMDVIVLQSLADQAAVAIENARLYEQTHHLAVLEERQRLARELHDSVTQALYGMTLFTAATSDLLTMGDITTAANHLQIMQETAQLALREMRLLIFQLRSPSLEQGLAAALQERLESVEQRSGVKPTFRCTGIGCTNAKIDEALYRIAQEALNNTLKHARSQTVEVILTQEPQRVFLDIRDDGVGFVVEAGSSGGMGLRGMAERVSELNGTLTIQSSPGTGTTISVEVPLK